MSLKEKINKNVLLNLFKNLIFVVSVPSFTFLLINIESMKQDAISVFASFLVTLILTFKFKIREKIFENFKWNYSIIAILLAIATNFTLAKSFYAYHSVIEPTRSFFLNSRISDSLAMFGLILIALYATYSFYYYFVKTFVPKAIDFFKGLEKTEKYFLIASTAIFSIGIIVIYSYTSVFYLPKLNHENVAFDVIYSSDTGAHAILNDYIEVTAVENDIRQPLFAVFALPFSIVAYTIGNLFSSFDNGYFVLVAIIQVFLMNIISIILSRMLKLDKTKSLIFSIFYAATYPFILFAFNLEQYVFGLFWLFCFLYSYTENGIGNKFCFIGATGSLLTNAILFPLLTKGKKIKKCFSDFIKTGFGFASMVVVFGQLPILLNLFSTGAKHVGRIFGKKYIILKYNLSI